MKRIAIFRSELLPISETFIAEQARALKGWEPVLVGRRVIAAGPPTPGIPREIVPVASSRIAKALRLAFWLPEPRLSECLKALQVRLVHVHFATDATEVWPSIKALGLPMVVTLHGYDINIHRGWWESGKGGVHRLHYPRRLQKMAQDKAVTFIAVSDAIKQRAVDYGLPAEKITVAPIGVDTQRFKPGGLPVGERRKRILFVGRMVEKKAPLLTVHAFAELRKMVADAELSMVGDGPLLQPARRLAAELAVPVTFLSARSPEEVRDLLQQASVFCLPSRTARNGDAEGLPISLLEAQACGIPCVTTHHSGNSQAVLDGVTGRCVPEGDAAALARALADYLSDPALRAKTGEAAAAHCREQFDLSARAADLENIYARAALYGGDASTGRSESYA